MIVLALDIATATGAAWDGPDGQPVFATHRAPDLGLGLKCKSFAGWLDETIMVVGPDLVAVEAPLMRTHNVKLRSSIETDRLLITLAGMAHYVAACSGLAVVEKNVQEVKAYFVGGRHVDKPAMIARARLLGWNVRNDHEADAGALWALVRSQRDPQFRIDTTPLFGRHHD